MTPSDTALAGVTLTVVGVVVCWRLQRDVRRGRASAGWPQALGVVESSDVVEGKDADGHPAWRAEVRYRYSVGGVTHHGDVVRALLRNVLGPEAFAKDQAVRHPVGQAVVVRYHPERPDIAVLETGVPWYGYAMLACGVACIILGGVFLITAIRELAS
jgi:hypothetical protein